jgi:DNA-directed RNA polymerase subunit RPC12/RpoP
MACGAPFAAAPDPGTLPPGGAVTTRKFSCASCGALLLFDAESGVMACRFCGGTRAVEREEGFVAVENALETEAAAAPRRVSPPKVFRCKSCGAEVSFPGHVVADACPFCGSTHVVAGTAEADRVRPQAVVPFGVGEASARERWKTWIRGGWFRPSALRKTAGISALRGVYVPFWTYDTRTWSRWTAQAGYRETFWTVVGSQRRMQVRIRWQFAAGDRRDFYNDVLVCASRGVDEALLEHAYPYRVTEAQPYRDEYLAGWSAEEYAIELTTGWHRARERVNQAEIGRCARAVPGDTHRALHVWTQHSQVTWKHVLLPVWLAAYRYGGKRWLFLVNGQTGRISGRAPVSWVKVTLAVAAAAAVAFLAWRLFGH